MHRWRGARLTNFRGAVGRKKTTHTESPSLSLSGKQAAYLTILIKLIILILLLMSSQYVVRRFRLCRRPPVLHQPTISSGSLSPAWAWALGPHALLLSPDSCPPAGPHAPLKSTSAYLHNMYIVQFTYEYLADPLWPYNQRNDIDMSLRTVSCTI